MTFDPSVTPPDSVTPASVSSQINNARGTGYDELLDFFEKPEIFGRLTGLDQARVKWANTELELIEESAFQNSAASKAIAGWVEQSGKIKVSWAMQRYFQKLWIGTELQRLLWVVDVLLRSFFFSCFFRIDSVLEDYSLDDLVKKTMAVKASPTRLSGREQLEYYC